MEPAPDDSPDSNDDMLSEASNTNKGYRPELDAYPMEVLEAVLKILKAQTSGKSLIKNGKKSPKVNHP